MSNKEMMNDVELVMELTEEWQKLAKLVISLNEYCMNYQIDMVKETIVDLREEIEYLVIVVMEIYNRLPESRQDSEKALLYLKQITDDLNAMEKNF